MTTAAIAAAASLLSSQQHLIGPTGPSCGSVTMETMVDFVSLTEHNVSITEEGIISLDGHDEPLDLNTCSAVINSLRLEIDQTSLGEFKFLYFDYVEEEDPSPVPVNIWSSTQPLKNCDDCPTIAEDSTFQDIQTKEFVSVTLGDSTITIDDQTVDFVQKGCTFDIKLESFDVPVTGTFLTSSGNDRVEHTMIQFQDLTGSVNEDPIYPLNVWQMV